MSRLDQAVSLLRDEQLVWSDDFAGLRAPLAELLRWLDSIDYADATPVRDLITAVLAEDGDIGLADPFEDWIFDAARQLGIYQETASRSEAMAAALKRLLGRL